MEKIDKDAAARVWQRVTAGPETPQPAQGLLGLIGEELADSMCYLQLSRAFQGRESTQLKQMYHQAASHAACLKGIYTLITGDSPAVRAVPPAQEAVAVTLRRCYGRQLGRLAQYEGKSRDPEYGPVYAQLAARKKEHCCTLLELLGRLGKK